MGAVLTLSDMFLIWIKRPSGSTSHICIKPAALEEVAATCFFFFKRGPSLSRGRVLFSRVGVGWRLSLIMIQFTRMHMICKCQIKISFYTTLIFIIENTDVYWRSEIKIIIQVIFYMLNTICQQHDFTLKA